MGRWSSEKAWAWYNSKPWIRGCNFIGSDCANRLDQWQSYGREERMKVADAELDEDSRFSVIKADARRAFEYFREAAHHSPDYVEELVAKGQFLYAKCYVDGMGVDFDRNKSLRLMLIAGKNGSAEAVDYLASNGITEQMLLEAVKEGKKRPNN